MNEAVMQTALHDLLVTANLGAKQGMDLTIDHTGTHPEIVANGGTARISSGNALKALARYLKGVQAEWAWTVNGTKTDPTAGLDFDPDLLTVSGAAHLLNTNYHVGGANARTVGALAYGLMKVRRASKAAIRGAKNAEAIATAEASGGAYFAEGVTDKAGVAIKYANESKARKAWAREHFGGSWWGEMVDGTSIAHPDKASRLSQAVIQRGTPFTEVSEATEKVRAVQTPIPATTTAGAIVDMDTGEATVPTTTAPAPTTTAPAPAEVQTVATGGVTSEQAIAMAQALGSQARTEAGAIAYLAGKGINL